jgi:hypothetical protein
MMQLSEHFTLEELTASYMAVRKGVDNTPPEAVVGNLKVLAAALEQIRAAVGRPITVNCGYRCLALNRIVGGSSTSAHMQGLAADIVCKGLSAKDLALQVQKLGVTNLDQLIYEGTWVHVGLALERPRGQVLTATFPHGKAVYTNGIN